MTTEIALPDTQLVVANHKNREIIFVGEVGDHASCEIVRAIRDMDKRNRKPITLIINTVGGGMWEGGAIYDAICLAKSRVLGQALGCCMSAGVMILQACDTRYVAPSCRLMIHDPSVEGKMTRKDRQELEYTKNFYYDQIMVKSNLSLAEIKKMCKNETYMSAEEAINYGFADAILQ